ncbi:hypothetical protein RO3G_04691 [Rhizopus delemar RA 99-880]|uniref:Uncharacterized protein n=1 Tax=Rhizopus delemar (strain RA 99-880 / ATCC MYA-4621 / FGSC 9543 / NRRL 43880) TaxID=246409 RepID=I1BUV6_RHIO9|nr:hypothetical protein RO3G_04691 [Rhizopus delemar RA 99-880]|eukprot:EIE79986.1 hypothetical protein RO3G_04691 [Rhizopus delemar RA 99-880]
MLLGWFQITLDVGLFKETNKFDKKNKKFESVYNEDNWLQGTCLACVLRVLYQKIQR